MRLLSAEWVLPISSPPVRNGAVVIDGDTIVAVGAREKLLAEFTDAVHEELGAAAILPGFVNCHAHLELTIMRGLLDDVENDFLAWLLKLTKIRKDFLTDKDIELSSLLGAAEAARAGVTCIGDVGRSGPAGLAALKQVGLRGVVYQETEFSPDNTKAAEDLAKLKEKFLSLKENETDLVEIGLSPHSPYTVSAEMFKLIADFAIAENIKTTIHAAESAIEDDFILRGEGVLARMWQSRGNEWKVPGISSIEYLSSLGVLESKPLLVHCVNTDENDLSLIAASNSPIAHCPKSNAKFGHGIAPLAKFLDNKITVGLGSDSVASNNACDLIDEARFASLVARAHNRNFLSADVMLEMMTLGGAAALGLDDVTGSLDAGKQADIAVVSLENIAQMPVHDVSAAIVFSSNARDVVRTIVAGRDVYLNRKLSDVDEDALRRDAVAVAEKIAAENSR